jgi:predicted dehydrogenase
MLNGAIIGLGKIAQMAHIPAYLNYKFKDKIRITAGVDISENNRSILKKLFPEASVYPTIEEMYSNNNIDFIDICVPPLLHKKYIIFALKNNINVLCEKPFTSKLSEAKYLKNLLLNSDIVYYPVHQYKYSPIWKLFKKVIVNSINANKIFLQFNVYRMSADLGFDNNLPSWRTNKNISGGGILADTGSHYLYLVNWLLGKPLNITSLNYKLKKKPYKVEDTTMTIMNSRKGIAEINLTWAADKRMNTAYMSDGIKSLYYDGSKLTLSDNGESKNIDVPNASDKNTYITLYEDLITDFIKEINSKRTNEKMVIESLNVIKMLDYCYKSSKSKKTLTFE